MAERPDLLKEAATVEIGNLLNFEDGISSLEFLSNTLGNVLERFQTRFGHISKLMKSFNDLLREHKINLKELYKPQNVHKLKERNHPLGAGLAGLINEFFLQEKQRRTVEMMELLFTEEQVQDLQACGAYFLERSDLYRPNEFNAFRTFPLTVNGQAFECTLCVSPGGDQNVSFVMDSNRGKKMSPILHLNPDTKYRPGLSQTEAILLLVYEMAKDLLHKFEQSLASQGLLDGVTDKHGTLQVFDMLLKLQSQAAESDAENAGKPDFGNFSAGEVAAAKMGADGSWFFGGYLNAPDFAALSVKNVGEFVEILNDKPAMLLHVMRGLMRVFSHVLAKGSGGKAAILDSFGPKEQLLIKLNGGGMARPENEDELAFGDAGLGIDVAAMNSQILAASSIQV